MHPPLLNTGLFIKRCRGKIHTKTVKLLSSNRMLVVATVFLLATILALIQGEFLYAGLCVLASVLSLDGYRRDKRRLGR
jgi:hypothetical protein